MSIFPKRTVAGSTVTIHWNLSLPAGMNSVICPYVRIGIIDPGGHTHMLFEQHVLLLPSTAAPVPVWPSKDQPYMYLNKHTPLLVLASYLAGSQPREKLVEILTNLQNGRHYYFTWAAPPDAIPGKYTLLSEMYLNGSLRKSATAAEDFFYIEQLDISQDENNRVTIYNPGPERVPVKIITLPLTIEVFYIEPGSNYTVPVTDKNIFLVYNEERIAIPLHSLQKCRPLRNQQYHFLQKEGSGYILPNEGDDAFRLTGIQREIWEAANGILPVEMIRQKDQARYDEMIVHGLLKEIE